MNKLHNQIRKAKKGGISMVELARMKAVAQKSAQECEQRALEKAFILMLGIPICRLIEDYWKKTAKQRIPKFIEDCISAYDSLQEEVITYEDLVEMIEEYSGVSIEAEWLKRRNEDSYKESDTQ